MVQDEYGEGKMRFTKFSSRSLRIPNRNFAIEFRRIKTMYTNFVLRFDYSHVVVFGIICKLSTIIIQRIVFVACVERHEKHHA